MGLPSLSEDSRRTARMRSAGFEGSGSGSCSELLLLELSELLSSDSSSAGFGGTGASCSTRGGASVSKDSSELSSSGGAAGASGAGGSSRSRWGFSSLLFCPLSIRSACFCRERVPRVFFFFHSPSFQWYSGGGLSHHARPFLQGGSSRCRLPLAGSCAGDLGRRLESLLAAWRSFHAATPSQPCHGSVGSLES